MFSEHKTTVFNPSVILAILYSGIVVALISRVLNIASYERIGSAVSSSLMYLETVIAILIPIIILKETISLAMIIGVALILTGVAITEHHKSTHHKHLHIFRSH